MLQHAFCIHLILPTCRTNTFVLPSNGSNSIESAKSKAVQSIEFSFVFTHSIRITSFRYNLIGNTIISLTHNLWAYILKRSKFIRRKCINVPKWGINAHQIRFWIFHTRQINSPNFMIFDLAHLVNSNSFTIKLYRSEIQSIPDKWISNGKFIRLISLYKFSLDWMQMRQWCLRIEFLFGISVVSNE